MYQIDSKAQKEMKKELAAYLSKDIKSQDYTTLMNNLTSWLQKRANR